MDDWNERVDRVAQEILLYLETCPQAADSLEGIAVWWISQQRIHSELEVVRAALERLSGSGAISEDGRSEAIGPVYHLNERNH